MSGPIANNPGVQRFALPSLSDIGSKIMSGLKSIGEKICQFGGMIKDGLASIFSSSGKTATAQTQHSQPYEPMYKALPDKTFTIEEMEQHETEALNSDFYKSLEGSGDSYVNQTQFKSLMNAVLSTPKTVSAMQKYGVSLSEAISISMYSSQAYRQINNELRNPTGDRAMQGLATAFKEGLEKLPSFNGNPVEGPNGQTYYQCFRGALIPPDVSPNYLEGNIVTERGITSTTSDPSCSFKGVNFQMVILLKENSQGKDISAFSDKAEECEVAFPPDVQFQVDTRRLDSGGNMNAQMEKTYHPAYREDVKMVADLVMHEV